MKLESDRPVECRLAARASCWLVPVACLQALGACTTDVAIFKPPERRIAGAAGTEPSNSPNVLIAPGSSTPNADVICQPGHYIGAFYGTYNSAAWGNGSVPLSIAATPSMERPGLEFWLERTAPDCRSDQEFCADFTVRGGKIRGYANPFSNGGDASSGDATASSLVVAVRFEIDFGGQLDCSRGQFRGLLQNGCYDVATVLYRFEGTAPANYDPATASFTDGQWMVEELASTDAWLPPDSDIGGMGSWQASLVNDAADPAADSSGLCDM